MTIDQYISDFLRDAQYRIAQLTVAIKNGRKEGSEDPNFYLLKEKRKALVDFMDLAYDLHTNFYTGYNFLKAATEWSDREIISEIEYLRSYTDMTRIPFGAFAGFYPTIVNNILGNGFSMNVTFPEGDYLNILRYNSSGQLQAVSFPEYAGDLDNDIDEYFTGRL